jgi:hypothetical protein
MNRFMRSLRAKVMSLTADEAILLDDIISKLRDNLAFFDADSGDHLSDKERAALARFSLRVVEMRKHGTSQH